MGKSRSIQTFSISRNNLSVSLSVSHTPSTNQTHIKMPDQPETVAAEVPVVEDQVDAPVKEAVKEVEAKPEEVANGAAEGGEEAPAE